MSSTIHIKTSLRDSKNNIPEQYELAAGNITVRIFGTEQFIRYPSLSRITDHEYTCQLRTTIQDWKYVAKAISGSVHSLQEKAHNAKVVANKQQGYFEIQTNTQMQMSRKVYFDSATFGADKDQCEYYEPWFCCAVCHLTELVIKNKKKKKVVVCFDDQGELESNSSGAKKEPMTIMFRFPDEVDKNGVIEKSVVVFSRSIMWNDIYWSEEHEEINSRFEIMDI